MSRRTACIAALLLVACAEPSPLHRSAQATPRVESQGPPRPLRVAVVSDLNGSYGSCEYGDAVHAAVDRLLAVHPDIVLSTGDMVAGQRRGLDYEGMWEGFHGAVSDELEEAGVPFAVTPGNHDASGYPAFASERARFVNEWSSRRPDVEMVDDAHYPLRYAFRRGPALFVSLDATTVGPLSTDVMAWLDRVLANHDAPVKVVFGHVPLYPFTHGREREAIGDHALEDLLVRRGVDLFLSGHHHAYYPGRRGALRLVSTACLGGGPRPLIGTDRPSERSLILMEIDETGVRSLDAFAGAALDRRVARRELPRSVGEGERRILRDDVPANLVLD